MRVLMFFRDMRLWNRYKRQVLAIASRCDKFYVHYWDGKAPYDSKYFTFIRDHRKAMKVQVDVVYVLSGRWLQVYGAILAIVKGIPLVIRMRGDERAADMIFKHHPVKRVLKLLARMWTFSIAKKIIPISRKMGQVAFEQKGKNITSPIPNGVDLDIFKPGPYPDEMVVGWVGRDSPEKNPEFVKELQKALPGVKFLIAIGKIPYEKMPDFYNDCSVIILPSIKEGFSNVLLEAYACNRPVICSPGAIPEGFPGNPLPLDIETWKKAILSTNGQNLRHIAKQFTWEIYGERIFNHLNDARAR